MSTELSFDAAASRLIVETRAKGMLAKLAHDLSLSAGDLSAKATLDAQKLSVELDVPIASLRVDGVKKGAHVDKSVLSSSDRAEIERKIREEVLKAASVTVKTACEAPTSLLEDGSHEVAAPLTVEVGRGRTEVRTRAAIATKGVELVARGKATVSMPSLGLAPVKGPLGAFRVDDDIEIVYELVFKRA